MSAGERVPADMLLLRERQRRLREPSAMEPATTTIHPATDDDLLLESDAIVDAAAAAAPVDSVRTGVALYRPLAYVSLGGMSWSGAVDHDALQSALVCAPIRSGSDERAPQWLNAVTTLALAAVPSDEPALYVLLAADDIAALDRAGMRLSRDAAVRLVRGAALPETIVGVDASTAGPSASVLSAYRHAALVFAWQSALTGNAAADVVRDRDAAAVQLVSLLRALLGEM